MEHLLWKEACTSGEVHEVLQECIYKLVMKPRLQSTGKHKANVYKVFQFALKKLRLKGLAL